MTTNIETEKELDKNSLLKEYLEEHDPYNPPNFRTFDLRGYSKYIKEHHIPHDEIPQEIMNMFFKNKGL